MQAEAAALDLRDLLPSMVQLRREIFNGLRSEPKKLSPKFFYDARGSVLFDAICEQPEYYPTRTELGIMQDHAADMARALGRNVMVVELGSGSSFKTGLLLDALVDPCAYVPIDISREHLASASVRINAAYPALEVLPVCADFTHHFHLPEPRRRASRVMVYFPGSTIGNFEPTAATHLLSIVRGQVGEGGGLLIGVDLKKDKAVLDAAYNDAAGVTADFNLNLLLHLNHLVDAEFNPERFVHHAFYNEEQGRVEMHLVSRANQLVPVGGETIEFLKDESIHTENSYKYSLTEFAQLARQAGFVVETVWTDARQLFSVQLLRANGRH